MNRNEKLKKLASAFKDWRGAPVQRMRKRIRPPRQEALRRVIKWLKELKMDVQPTLQLLAAFTSYSEFNAWIVRQ